MGRGRHRGGGSPSDSLALKKALANAALGQDRTLRNVPFNYVLLEIAREWGVAPWVIEDDDRALDWLLRTIEFRRLEGSVRSG